MSGLQTRAGAADAELRLRVGRGRPAGALHRRRRGLSVAAAVVVWSALVVVGPMVFGASDAVNTGGWPQVRDFLVAAARPALDRAFLGVVWDATLTTMAYAVLGTALAMALGVTGGALLAETSWRRPVRDARPRPGWYVLRGTVSVPRGIHEAVWGLLLVSVLGLDPLVGVLAIGIPFGAVSAKVVADLVDETAAGAYQALRAAGAGRITALLYGIAPMAGADIVSYGFYRLECAVRAAAILGVIGAGGLGFELALSFQALRYGEMWTLLYALLILSGLADLWSARLRRGATRPVVRVSLLGGAALVAASLWHLDLSVAVLWSSDTVALAGRTVADAWPPTSAGSGTGRLVRLSLETVAMSVVAMSGAAALAVPLAFLAARRGGPVHGAVSWGVRALLLVLRAIPPPVGAFVVLLVLFPGPLPGAVALALYNLGVVGRLLAEVVENADPRPATALQALGATGPQIFAYGVLPVLTPRFAAYSLYRWEVALRETVVVGLVGAGGLGRLLGERLAAFDHAGAAGVVLTLALLAALVDLASAGLRRSLR